VRALRLRAALALAVIPGPADLAAVLFEPGAVLGREDAHAHGFHLHGPAPVTPYP
jgi:hypothetical protein